MAKRKKIGERSTAKRKKKADIEIIEMEPTAESVAEVEAAIAEAVGHTGKQAIDVALGARAALHGDAEGLVEHQHVLILVEDQAFDEVTVGLGKPGRWHERRRW